MQALSLAMWGHKIAYINVSSTKTNRLLQEEINATLMCHL